MDTRFACSSISDTAGNLLFYTNGITVYNRNHKVMQNGDGLVGSIHSPQGCIIVQHPAYDNIYYVFTTNFDESGPTTEYRYSVVDMAADNGNGKVTAKNVFLSSPSSARLTAARHADGTSVWLITNDRLSNVFRAWLINCNGLQLNPIVSAVGEIITDWPSNDGQLKVSPDGKQLCQIQKYSTYTTYNDPKRFFQLFDFDNATGKISNPRKIAYNDEQKDGCEYSPDSKLLYLFSHSLLINGQTPYYTIDQLEANLNTEAEIIASLTRINTCTGNGCQNNFFTSLQSGPDGKIYMNRKGSKLSVINYPNVKGNGCMFELDKIDIVNDGGLGLPNMINDAAFDPYNNFTATVIDSCNGRVQFNGQTAMPGAIQWLWDFGDGTTSNLQNPQHNFTPYNQPYQVRLTITSSATCGYILRKKQIFPRGIFRTPGFDFVARCDSGYVRFVNTSTFLPDTVPVQYIWNFGDGMTSTEKNPVHSYSYSGTFLVKLKIKTGTPCIDDSIVKNIDLQQLNIQAPPDQTLEAGQPVQLYVTGGGSSFQWSPPRWLSNSTIANPIAKPMDTITYVVTATDDAGCKATDSVTFYVKNTLTGINIPSAFTPNNDGLNDMLKPLLGSQYSLKEFCIYNRWGQKVFSTTEAGEGWDGTLNGRLQDTGTYVWLVKVNDAQNKIITKQGTVTLIR
ncbi:MAG: gliding motility-associated C-terminal domain-containing protein [Bacteroidetes bacterium]|nr:gliding motility-associated C-terminal domain-containing protein [Bacteroidota bacterium]